MSANSIKKPAGAGTPIKHPEPRSACDNIIYIKNIKNIFNNFF